MKTITKTIIILAALTVLAGCGKKAADKELAKFIDEHVQKIQPLVEEMNLAYWQASIQSIFKYSNGRWKKERENKRNL